MVKSVKRAVLGAYGRVPAVVRRNLHLKAPRPVRRSAARVGYYLTRPNRGTVSVVVPCYDVERYLTSCLTSILQQDYPYLEVLVVDDGSPDRSAAIASRIGRWDRRVRVIRRTNGGLGAARNTGIQEATGRYITFVDSDDTIPQGAIRAMVDSLAATGSDFAIGSIERVQGGKRWTPKWAREVHRTDRLRMTLGEDPEVLKDVFATNKLFKREFFDRVVGAFPEGIRYEDQEPTARAFVGAHSFDVLSKTVYSWFIRSDGSSITQQKADIRDLIDRLEVKQRVAEVIRDGAEPHVRRAWQAKAIGFDLHSYYQEVPRTSEEYWETLRAAVTNLATKMDDGAWLEVPVFFRVLALTTVRGTRGQLSDLLTAQQECGTSYALEPSGAGFVARPGYLHGLELPLDTSDLAVHQDHIKLRAEVTQLRWVGERQLCVEGHAYIGGLDAYRFATEVGARLVRLDAQGTVLDELPLTLEREERDTIDIRSNDAHNRYAPTGFRTTIDAAEVIARSSADAGEHVTWRVELHVEAAGLRRTGYFQRLDTRGSAGSFSLPPHVDGRRVALHFGSGLGLGLSVPYYRLRVEQFSLDDRQLRLVVSSRDGDEPRELVLLSKRLKRRLVVRGESAPDGTTVFSVKVPTIPPSAGGHGDIEWRLRARTSRAEVQLQMPQGTAQLRAIAGREPLRAELSPFGFLRLIDSAWYVRVTECDASTDGDVTVEGYAHIPLSRSLQLVLTGVTQINPAAGVEHNRESGHFRARFSLLDHTKALPEAPVVPMGGRALKVLTGGSQNPKAGYWPAVDESLQSSLPREWDHPRVRVESSCTPKGRSLWLSLSAPLATAERGRYAQRQLQLAYASTPPQPNEAFLFECYNGRSAADSPRAIDDELARTHPDIPRYWSVRDYSSPVPDGSEALLMFSRAWYEALRDASVLVNNNNFPYFFRKRAHQFYVQTWHGTPLKRIGNDVPATSLSLSYRALMEREAAAWDLLLAQNPFSVDVLPKAFGYVGTVSSLGYPRNDALVTDTDDRRRQVRSALGFDETDRVVLYAPTWRDNVKNAAGNYTFVGHVDIPSFQQELGPTWKMAVRGHANTLNAHQDRSLPGVVDVSRHPDINDLMLAADVLVTDYSSVMFDFCVTGKPILLLAPDLSTYRDTTRGFYLDLEEIAPGPIMDTTGELVECLRNLSQVTERYASRYRNFVEAFAPWDDGKASQRVLEQVEQARRGV